MSHDIVDKFTTQLKNVLTRALCFVVETNRQVVKPEHLLWALATQKGCIASEVLRKVDLKLEPLRVLVASADAAVDGKDADGLHLSDTAKRMLEKAVLTANVYGHRYVGTEHLLSGILQINDSKLDAFFQKEQIDLKALREHVSIVLKGTSKFPDLAESIEDRPELAAAAPAPIKAEDANAEQKKTPALDYFGRDLTSTEQQERIDPLIGRAHEVERVMEVLCRRTKNNPLLLGEPGVGKTAIVEGLAKRIAHDDVPAVLRGRRVVAIDLSLLIAGTMYRGEFEARMKQVVEEARANPNIILFIDEVHTIVGAGSASGSLDAANLLKPALARGDIRCIGATTPAEYKKHIENDSALERRFQTIMVEEPSEAATAEILRGVAPGYEAFHGVTIAPAAIDAAVRLSARYVQDKRMPDKALDLLDEAAASARVREREGSDADARRVLQTRLQDTQERKRQAVVEERFLDAVALKEEEDRLSQTLRASTRSASPRKARVIDAEDVARIVSRVTNIPLEDILAEERRHLSTLETALGARVIGQDAAVRTAASAVRRAKAGIAHPRRPLSSLLFLGPSGVGKTELAKAIAEIVFHDAKALTRLDMSEYAEGFTVSKLVGAPAGYVGYREHAKLTDSVKARPYGVVLFDELEKAHRDVQNLLLQILEEGEIADATGRKISFRQSVVILTSNVGLERFERGGIGFSSSDEERKLALDGDIRRELEERFRPELLNRIDQTVLFQPLTRETLAQIAHKQLRELGERLSAQGITFSFDDAVAALVAEGANAKFGARDVRRRVETLVEGLIADTLLSRGPKRALRVGVRGGRLTLTSPRPGR